MKKIIALMLTLTFIAAMAVTAAAADVPRLVDNAGLVPEQYFDQILTYLDSKSEELDFDIAVLTEESIGGSDIEAYADDYFDYNGFGLGEDGRDGILLVIVMDTREWAFSTSGFGVTVFGDYELGEMEDSMVEQLSEGNYAQGIYNYAQIAAYNVEYAREYGYDFSEDGYYTHDDPSYYDDYEREPMRESTKLGICGAIGSFISMLTTFGMKGRMSNVQKKSAASDYVRRGSLNIYRSNDYFLNKSVSRSSRYTESRGSSGSSTHHGGGSTHISSSGHSHGGSHGHF